MLLKIYYFILFVLYGLYGLMYVLNTNISVNKIEHYIGITHNTLQLFIAISLIILANPFYSIKVSSKTFKNIAFSGGFSILLSMGIAGILQYILTLKEEADNTIKNVKNMIH